MAFNGDMTRTLFGGIPTIIYEESSVFLGDISRSYFGGIPVIAGQAEAAIESGEVVNTITATDVFDAENATIKESIAETITLTSTMDGYGPWQQDWSETITITDAADGYALKDSTAETVTLTDEMSAVTLAEGLAETATLTDAWDRTFETETSASETVVLGDAMEGVSLTGIINEAILFIEQMPAGLENPHRRKQLLWNIQNEHIQIKLQHNQQGLRAHLIDMAIRCARIRKQTSLRFAHLGQHIQLKLQHNTASEGFAMNSMSMQVNSVLNPSAAPRDIQSVRFAHQGSHMQLVFRHNEAAETILLKSLAMTCNRTNNPP